MNSHDVGDPVVLARDGAVAVLRLNRPGALNALDVPLAEAFHAACRAIVADGGVRAVLLCAAGRSFGVGGDLSAMHDGDAGTVARQLIEPLHASLRLLAQIDAPVLAALQGAVAGGSMSLALSADLAVAADDARFNLAYARIGASCDVSGSWQLPRLVGLRRAMEIALLSETLDADAALRLGLVNRVVPAAQLAEQSLALAHRLADGPTLAFGRLKRLLRQSFDTPLDAQLDAEAEAFVAGTRTADFAEGLDAFLAKRTPRFEGR
ncbi:MAG: enoyl-CoA hydratase-related protein [Piscinibacter sp.]